MSESADITVVLCTFNRCESLRAALKSVAVSQMPENVSWEVLVVDNNSTDRTRAVVAEFEEQYAGRFRCLWMMMSRSSQTGSIC